MAIRRRKVQGVVRDLLATHKVTEAPVPVERIAKAQGARIFYKALEDDLSGFIYRENQQSVIGVNTHHAPVRQAFTIAHELGHLLLHDQDHEQLHVDRVHDFSIRLRSGASSEGTDESEMEANLFAAELLMPSAFLARDLKNRQLLDDRGVITLAKKYGVSTQALLIRLSSLGYIRE
jgi:Zn-dependent peptidase ImmA (M78 family)